MAQDPENQEEPREESSVDTSHDLDMATLYTSQGVDAEMEAGIIHGLLETNGIPSIMVRATGVPVLGFEVQVPRARLQEAERVVAEAEAAGPDAAAEGEAASEEGR